ncbi:hypothetical protein QR98_0004380 [Sarcoptes scabiei]|uniref:Uncharacterized protein n=1 Tax=Sarcoptes scabiei TaxID=52283 RepID=A0A131ZTC4_SARSC|nr:hypothetical protein QR98_0004380 [Sarcoptes scabiei]
MIRLQVTPVVGSRGQLHPLLPRRHRQ